MPKNQAKQLSRDRIRVTCECGNIHELSLGDKEDELVLETIRTTQRHEPKKNDEPPAPKQKPKAPRLRTLLSREDDDSGNEPEPDPVAADDE